MKSDSQSGTPWRTFLIALTIVFTAAGALSACDSGGGTSSNGDDSGSGSSSVEVPELEMGFPDSLTGGASGDALTRAAADEGPQCNFEGHSGEDPFQNGYFMTQFLVGQVATWICLTDFLMAVTEELDLPDDGSPTELPTDPDDPDSPSHMSFLDDGGAQGTINVYWDDDTGNAGMYLSWVEEGESLEGRLIIAPGIMGQGDDPGAPSGMRMDFAISDAERSADVYLAFPESHPFRVAGFHIQVVKDESEDSFEAKGIMDMTGQPSVQFDEGLAGYVTATPSMKMLAVASEDGEGAAVASFADFGIGFPIPEGDNHLGYYQFTKTDTYFFTETGADEWINKTITDASYRGGSNFDTITEGDVDDFLGLSGTTAACTAGSDSDCVTLLNAIFTQGDFAPELDSGSDPRDWRSDAIADPGYLDSPYPEGSDSWDGVFDMEFSP